MKKLPFLAILFSLLFFTTNLSYCEEDFFMDTNFEKAKTEPKITSKKVANSINKSKKKFFNFFNKNKKDEDTQKGYYGTLPNVKQDFQYKQQNLPVSDEIDMNMPKNEDFEEENLKEAPFDDSLFLDMVIKKETDSEYLSDIQKIKFALNNLKNCLEEEKNIQHYNACVNSLDLYVQSLQKKYRDKSESMKESYMEILNTNYYSKLLGNLKYDANYYARLIPVSTGKYSKDNISFEEKKLLNRVNKTIFILNNES